MEAKELRIGNLVYGKCVDELENPPEYWEPYKIDAETLLNINAEFDKPIQLTEEWLLKFHFSKIGLNYSFHAYGVEFIVWTKLIEFQSVGLYFRFGDFDIEIKYVHSLQNLYFALTNEELKNPL